MGGAGREASASDEAARDAEAGPVLDLERYVPGLLTFIANKLSRSATALYQREFGVNVTEWRILSQLAIEPGITAARICQVIGFDKGPVSRTLAGMERRGLLRQREDRADGRRRRIALTEAGRALHDRILPVALERERRLLACLDGPQRRALIAQLNAVHRHLDAVTAPIAVPPERAG